jgi:signal transduction histidine kinase
MALSSNLVALAVNARLARELVRSDPDGAEEVLDDVGSQASQALASLRDLARGVFPAALADRGIGAALEVDLLRSHSEARLDGDETLAPVRYAPDVEAAVYFCCIEALQNAAKHAPEARAGVRLRRDGEWLVFEVADTGPGFDMTAWRGGTGLQGYGRSSSRRRGL